MQRHVNVYTVIAIATIAVALFAGWTSWSGYRISSTPAQMRVLLDARLLVSESRALLEERLGGDTSIAPVQITGLLDEAADTLATLAGHGHHPGTDAVIRDAALYPLLLKAESDLNALATLTRLRLQHRQSNAAGTDDAHRLDLAFGQFLGSSKTLQDRLHEHSADTLRWFVITQTLMALLVLATLGWIYRLLRVRDRREAATRAAMASAHAEVMQSREHMQRLNDRQNAMLAMSRKVQSAIGVEQFSQVLLTELCTAYDAIVGMVWLNRGKVGLRCVASRCAGGMGGRQLELEEGEGMVGQVAASGCMTSYEVPPGYLQIESGSLSLEPTYTILLPVRYQDETVAVFEFALLEQPDADKLSFVREILESMAVRYFMFSSRENPDSMPLSMRRTLAATA